MKDIAKIVGVSVVTVSRALNEKPDVNAETRERILQVAEELNYWPNYLAKSLRSHYTRTIGVVIPDIGDPFYAEILKGFTAAATTNNYQIILSALSQRGHDAIEEEVKGLKTLIAKRVDGLLLQPECEEANYIETLKKSPIPFVLWNRTLKGLNCNTVTNNHEYGSYLAVKYLIERGHKKIHYFVRHPRTSSVEKRIKGCFKAAKEHGVGKAAIKLVECIDSAQASYLLACQMIKNKEKFEAIYTWDDVMAIGVVKALSENGLDIPEKVSVIGYDDIEVAEYLSPPLTTIRQKTVEIGEISANLLISILQKRRSVPNQHIVLEPELVIRGTTR